jgi:hypothetical protein
MSGIAIAEVLKSEVTFFLHGGRVSLGKKIALLGLAVLWLAPAANASPTTLNFNSQGWVNSVGLGNGALNPNNAYTGNYAGDRYNSWANFDLSSLSGPVVSAQLEVTTVSYPVGAGPYTLGIYDVSTSYEDLQLFIGGVAAYNDFMTGNLYASSSFGDGTVLTLTLSSAAVADLNANLGGTFRVGFTNLTLNGVPAQSGDNALYTFNSVLIVNGDDRTPVPESSPAILLGTGMLVLLIGNVLRRA